MRKTYDQAYFDKWYRDPRHAVRSAAALKRKVA
ncbi:MAG TPA: methyltransferase, partial [Dyella sp.]|nr:methyltransferase [Dyella sp.]